MRKRLPVVLIVCGAFFLGLMAQKIGRLWDGARAESPKPTTAATDGVQKDAAATLSQQAVNKQLRAISTLRYVAGSRDATGPTGVTLHDRDRSEKGINLVSSLCNNQDGSKIWPLARLMDMDGNTLHTWTFDAFSGPDADDEVAWQSPHLFENGDLLVNSQSLGVVRLRADSTVVWRFPEGGCHHDLDVSPDGSIYVLSGQNREYRFQTFEHINKKAHVRDDLIIVLSEDWEKIKEVSLLDAFHNSDYDAFLFASEDESWDTARDLFHSNRVQVLDGSLEHVLPAFKANNVLISIRNFNTIAVVDMQQEKVEWVLTGMAARQHYPSLLENGNILIFDNFDSRQGNQEFSKVVEIEPRSQQTVWSYRGDPGNGFFSVTRGMAQRLSNGNTLIVESNDGRVFEVTPDNSIVWNYINHDRVVDEHGRHTSAIPHFRRYASNFPIGWATANSD